jgi:hypothetical protein
MLSLSWGRVAFPTPLAELRRSRTGRDTDFIEIAASDKNGLPTSENVFKTGVDDSWTSFVVLLIEIGRKTLLDMAMVEAKVWSSVGP